MAGHEHDELMDELAPIVDGDEEALERHAEALAGSDELRDLKHEAAEAADRVAEAGSDYEAPSEEQLEARVLEALDAREAATSGEGAPGEEPAAEPEGSEGDAEGGPTAEAQDEPAETEAGEASDAEARADRQAAGGRSETGGRRVPTSRLPGKWVLGGLGAVAAAAAVVLAVIAAQVGEEEAGAGAAGALADATFRGRIDRIVRAADDAKSGVAVREADADEFVPAGADDEIAPGASIRTDERTRARLVLSDGSMLTLDHDTEVRLDATDERTLHLERGDVVADVAHLDRGPNAVFEMSAGRVEVLGTKLAITATEDTASVRVTRGEVKVVSAGQSRFVRAGQEGTLHEGAAPAIGPAVNLASAVGWSELGERPEDDVPVPGIGELRAHRPGEKEEQERPLTLAHHQVTTRIVGNVARTEVHETFRNEGPHQLEGVYKFPLPPDARIASLSLKVDGKWEDGAFVARDRAKKIWRGVIRNATPEPKQQPQEEYIWVPGPWRDPALLEWQQGGRFELRIFPIPAEGEREIRIAYTQTLQPHDGGRRYVYPLAHSDDDSTRVGRFEVDVRIAGDAQVRADGYRMSVSRDDGARRLRYVDDDFLPAGDLVIDYALPGAGQELTWWTFRGDATAPPPERSREVGDEVLAAHRSVHRDDRPYVAFALRPELPAWTESEPRDYVLVLDASQSMVGERYARALRLVVQVIAEMDRRDRFVLMACDATCRRMNEAPQTPSGAEAKTARGWLEALRPAGASDLGRALRTAADVAAETGGDRDAHVLYFGDGLASVGHRRAASLAAEARALTDDAGLRIGAVGIGGDADATVLGAVARAGGGQYVPFVPGERTSSTALAVLESTYGVSLERPEIELPHGIVEVAPNELPTLRAGDELLLVGRMTEERVDGDVTVRGRVGGKRWTQTYPVSMTPSESKGNAFVPRLWAAKTIEELQLAGDGDHEPRIVALSKAFGVMSRHTSLLVLESEAMFRAFGVDRAKPSLQWTGDEPMEYGAAEGTESYRDAQVQQGIGSLGTGSGYGRGGGGASGAMDMLSGAEEAKPKRRARRSASRAAPAPDLDMAEDESAVGGLLPMRRRGPGRLMKRVWYREGRVDPAQTAPTAEEKQAVAEAEAALRQEPDSRDRHRALVRALSRAGRLDRAVEVAEQWLDRDPLDWEALTYLSDALGRKGERREALRLLSGIVDLQPEEDKLQRRMQNAFERAGMPERACAHAVARAEADPEDAERLAEAVRCSRALGRDAAAERLLEMAPEQRVRERAAAKADEAPTPRGPRGELLLEGSWQGGADVDLSLITPEGTRLSWMGGRVNVVGEDGAREGHEVIGLQRARPGTYVLEASRAEPGDGAPVRGEIEVRVLEQTRTLPFTLHGDRTVVGRVKVLRRSRLEQVR